MKSELNLIAFDLGASNGRCILGTFDGDRIRTQELHRFENSLIDLNGVWYWDILFLFQQLKAGLLKFKQGGYGDLASFGIDTWGVDYGLLDRNGRLLGNPISYRWAKDEDMQAVWEVVPRGKLFERTGIANNNFNTLYQLYRRKRDNDSALQNAETLLFTPDLLGYFLTGEKMSEYTIASTGMLYNPNTKDWDLETLKTLGLPHKILTGIDMPGKIRGRLLPAICDEIGVNRAALSTVGEHDTASAVAAIPGKESFAFCSTGTWSVFGVETDKPVLTEDMYKSNFSNEGTVQGGFSPLVNIMGLWLIQECRREWKLAGETLTWDEIVELAKGAPELVSIIDPDYGEFFSGSNMVSKIREYCRNTNQLMPETKGEIARCIYQSLALKYRWAVERLEELKGEPISQLNLVGGGVQNKLLNQMAADATGKPVVTGPIEGACIGNLLMQAVAMGELKNISEVREVVAHSVEVETYLPKHSDAWEEAYQKLIKLIELSKDK
ncbi:MAG: rhamnulokinase [Eubacteriales bacterium]|nr:rhamnulokinase [Eubacteriales bacterium]